MSAPKEPFYDERISPLMSKIIDLCKEAGINMAAQFSLGYDDENDSTLFCTTVLTPDAADKTGTERMFQLRRTMYERPNFAAFTIITSGGSK